MQEVAMPAAVTTAVAVAASVELSCHAHAGACMETRTANMFTSLFVCSMPYLHWAWAATRRTLTLPNKPLIVPVHVVSCCRSVDA